MTKQDIVMFLEMENQPTVIGSPIQTPRKIVQTRLAFSKASKPYLKYV